MNNTLNIKVLIEIPENSRGVKYEIEKETGHIIVDRFLKVAMHYPCNYGHIPETLAGDGDALDVLVITPFPLETGVYIDCRPIGVLNMKDEKGDDAKIIAVPSDHLTSDYQAVQSTTDIETQHPGILDRLRHFFEHYKGLDEGKWVSLQPGWGEVSDAEALIQQSIETYEEKNPSHI